MHAGKYNLEFHIQNWMLWHDCHQYLNEFLGFTAQQLSRVP